MAKKPTKTTSLRNSRGDESRREPVSDDRTPREECKQRRTKEPRLSPRREGHRRTQRLYRSETSGVRDTPCPRGVVNMNAHARKGVRPQQIPFKTFVMD